MSILVTGRSEAAADRGRPTGPLARFHLDLPLLVLLIGICAFGAIVVYSAGRADMDRLLRHIGRLALGFATLVAMAQIPPERLRRAAPWIFLATMIPLAAVPFFGDASKGAQRWLDLGGIRFQPSELLKLSLPLMLAWLATLRPLPIRGVAWVTLLFAVLAIPTGLIAKQPDLGTAVLVLVGGATVLFLAGLSMRTLALLGGAGLAAAPVAWFGLEEYQKQRILTFLSPETDTLGSGYHIIQSKIAIGSGGPFGKGWMQGTQAQLEFLPEGSTDFIFAVLAEDFGLNGALALIVLYIAVVVRGLYLASRNQDSFARLLSGSLILTFSVYFVINIGMVTGLLPVVGVPLPLVSYGGTSMVTLLAGFGILMSTHTHRRLLPA